MKIFSFEPNINNYFTQKKSIIKNNFNNITRLNIAPNDHSWHGVRDINEIVNTRNSIQLFFMIK